MEMGVLSLKFIFLIFVVFTRDIKFTECNSFSCYSCSYTITGEPSVNFECADSPWNFTVGQPVIACDDTRYCITKTVYEKGYKKIKSVSRRCGTPETFGCGKNCCQGSIYDDTCQYQCQGQLCNGENEARRIRTGSGNGDATKPGSVASSININTVCVTICLFLSSFLSLICKTISTFPS